MFFPAKVAAAFSRMYWCHPSQTVSYQGEGAEEKKKVVGAERRGTQGRKGGREKGREELDQKKRKAEYGLAGSKSRPGLKMITYMQVAK